MNSNVMRPILIDGNSLASRAIMATVKADLEVGTMRGGIHSTMTMLKRILSLRCMRYCGPIFAFFDCGVPDFRLQLVPEYKQTRKELRKKLLTEDQREKAFGQLKPIRKMFRALGIVTKRYGRREADDAVAAAAAVLVDRKTTPVIVTSDTDLLQCVYWGAEVYRIGGIAVDCQDTFQGAYNTPLEHWLLCRVLAGKIRDGIPGAPGVGVVHSRRIVEQYGERVNFNAAGSAQVRSLCACIRKRVRKNPDKQAESVLSASERLCNEADAIDLSTSFGSTTAISDALATRLPVDRQRFRELARKYKVLQSLAYDPQFFKPFIDARFMGAREPVKRR